MKRTVSICIFCVLVLIGTIYVIKENQKIEERLDDTGAYEQTETEMQEPAETIQSMEAQLPYEYVILEKDGYLVVYEKDWTTIYFESAIRMDELSNEMQKEIQAGIKFQTIEAVYDFLENYSS